MFNGCSALRNINISNFDLSKAPGIPSLFTNCTSLRTVDISGIDTTSLPSSYLFINVFSGCSSLQTIYASDKFVIPDGCTKTNNMFKGCSALVGGSGTKFDADQIDGAYARIDRWPFAPGYFTAKDPSAVTSPYDALLLNNSNSQTPGVQPTESQDVDPQVPDPQTPVDDPKVDPTPTEGGAEDTPSTGAGEVATLVGVPLALAALGFRRRIRGKHVKL